MKKNPDHIIAVIILFGLMIVAYVANVIFIRNYLKEIDKKKNILEVLLNENKGLRAIHESLIAKDRIVKIATTELGMIYPAEAPHILVISKEKLENVEAK